jgi:16S rRNA (adenine1518-N6/adenine1519-N6)-dimethyltransferase
MRPKKSLGQNFLINANAARRIAATLELKPGEQVLEIGGGRGDLTQHLVETGAAVISVEVDPELVIRLGERFKDYTKLRVIESDILKVEPERLVVEGETLKLVGNIPYNLTAPILEWIVDHREVFPTVALMMQKEVAERITAEPGGKEFGSLTIFVQLFYQAEKVFDLKPGSFFPKPKVNSAVVRMERLPEALVSAEEFPHLRRLTSACFRWRRKQILRILREEYALEPLAAQRVLEALTIAPTTRPEQLAIGEFVAIARRLRCVKPDSA